MGAAIGKERAALTHHHGHTSPSEEDQTRQLVALVVGHLCFEFQEANASLAEEIDMLNINRTELVGGSVKRMGW